LYATLGGWLYRDASHRGSEWVWQWATAIPALLLFTLVPGLLVLIVYLLVRDGEPADVAGEAAAQRS
jgi:hypothetical protein